MATAEAELALERLPDDLKDHGWKLERKVINDDEDHPDYVVHNPELGLATEAFPLVSRAVAEARKLADFSPSDEEEKRATVPAKPVIERTFEDEYAALRELLKDQPDQPLMIPHTVFRLDGGTQPREQLDNSKIIEYAEAKERGDIFPPVDAFFDGERLWLAGGFHRYFSDELLKRYETLTKVHYGTRRDAVLFSLGENATHGLPRSNADKRRAVLTLLNDPEWTKWADNVIAPKVQVSQPFVSSIRRILMLLNDPEWSNQSDAAIAAKANAAESLVREVRSQLSQNVLSDRLAAAPADTETPTSAVSGDVSDTADQPGQISPPQTKRIGSDGIERETKNIGRNIGRKPEDQIKVTDKRRVTADSSSTSPARTSIEGLLKGRKLAVSFVWIPGVEGKVHVSVNASDDPQAASRQLLPINEYPRFPEPVLNLIKQQLAKPVSKKPSKPKTTAKKKPVRSTRPTRPKPKTKKTARKK